MKIQEERRHIRSPFQQSGLSDRTPSVPPRAPPPSFIVRVCTTAKLDGSRPKFSERTQGALPIRRKDLDENKLEEKVILSKSEDPPGILRYKKKSSNMWDDFLQIHNRILASAVSAISL